MHYWKKSKDSELVLTLREVDSSTHTFQIYMEYELYHEIARGPRELLQDFLKVNEQLAKQNVAKFKELATEAEKIVTLFNKDFKKEIRIISKDIEDGHLDGNCEFENEIKHRL